MNYDIKIANTDGENEFIEFDRLNDIMNSTKDIAIKAFMLKTTGFSGIKPEEKLKNAFAIRLEKLIGNRTDGTSLLIECDLFEKTINSLQLEFFSHSEELFSLSPISLVIQSFRAALLDDQGKDALDKPLLKSLLKFKKNFTGNSQTISFSNSGSIAAIEVRKKDFEKIKAMEDHIPEPSKVIMNGHLDEVKLSKSRFGLITVDGEVNLIVNNPDILSSLIKYLGKQITLQGMAHYKPSGKLSYLEVTDFSEPSFKDYYFSNQADAMTVEQQVFFQLEAGKKKNALSELAGQWPGDESDEEFNRLLKELD